MTDTIQNVRKEILEAAIQIVTNDRNTTYGTPEDSFGDIATLASTLLGKEITKEEVVLFLVCVKLARLKSNKQHKDSWIDLAGYAACGAEVALRTPPTKTVSNSGFAPDVIKYKITEETPTRYGDALKRYMKTGEL